MKFILFLMPKINLTRINPQVKGSLLGLPGKKMGNGSIWQTYQKITALPLLFILYTLFWSDSA